MLGLGREFADRHVFDHAPPQWAHGLLGHGDAPVLSEGCEPLISRQDAPSRYRIGCVARRVTLPRERFSPLTHSGLTRLQIDALQEVYLPRRVVPASAVHGSIPISGI